MVQQRKKSGKFNKCYYKYFLFNMIILNVLLFINNIMQDEEECLKGKNKINIDNEKKLIEFQEKLEK